MKMCKTSSGMFRRPKMGNGRICVNKGGTKVETEKSIKEVSHVNRLLVNLLV